MYSIKFGNEKQLFKIDQYSGEIFITSPNGLQRSKDNITLTIVVSIYMSLCIFNHNCLDKRTLFFFLGN